MDDDADAKEALEREVFQIGNDRDSSDSSDSDIPGELEGILYSNSHYALDLCSEPSLLIDKSNPIPCIDLIKEPKKQSSCVKNTKKIRKSNTKRYYDKVEEDANDEVKVCGTCKETGHSKRHCPNWKRDMICHNCNETGHFFKECKRGVFCYICNETGHIGKDCKNNKNEVVCYNCKEIGHMSWECKKDKVCYICNDSGHVSSQCQKLACSACGELGHKAQECKKSKRFTCFNCGEAGHIARNCSIPIKERRVSNVVCRCCGGKGHYARDCSDASDDISGSLPLNIGVNDQGHLPLYSSKWSSKQPLGTFSSPEEESNTFPNNENMNISKTSEKSLTDNRVSRSRYSIDKKLQLQGGESNEKAEGNAEDSTTPLSETGEGNAEDSTTPLSETGEGNAEDSTTPVSETAESNVEDSTTPLSEIGEGKLMKDVIKDQYLMNNKIKGSESSKSEPVINMERRVVFNDDVANDDLKDKTKYKAQKSDVINLSSDSDGSLDKSVAKCMEETDEEEKTIHSTAKDIKSKSYGEYSPLIDLGLDDDQPVRESESSKRRRRRSKKKNKEAGINTKKKDVKDKVENVDSILENDSKDLNVEVNSIVEGKVKGIQSLIDHKTLNNLRNILRDSGDEDCDMGAISDHLSLPSINLESDNATDSMVIENIRSSCGNSCYGGQINRTPDRTHYNPTELHDEHLDVYGVCTSPLKESRIENQMFSRKRKQKANDSLTIYPKKQKRPRYRHEKKSVLKALKKTFSCNNPNNVTPEHSMSTKTKQNSRPRKVAKDIIVLD